MMNEVRGELFLRRLPPEIRGGLSPDQEAAIRAVAARAGESESRRIDVRFTLPTPWGPYYVALFAGPERRSPARRQQDRREPGPARAGTGLRATLLGMLLLAALLIYGTVGGF